MPEAAAGPCVILIRAPDRALGLRRRRAAGGREGMLVSEETVTALYLGLLGYPPDSAGLAHWTMAPTVQAVIDELTATERFRERFLTLTGEGGSVPAGWDPAQAAWRLESGRGLVELVDLPRSVPLHVALEGLPWDEVCAGIPAPSVQVLGRYAVELVDEMIRRRHATHVTAGLQDDRRGEVVADVLVLTGGEDLAGIQWARPELVRAVRQRIVLPVRVEADRPDDETATLRTAARTSLHALGFAEVHHVFRRRFGGGPQRIDTTYSTPDAGVLHTVVHQALESSRIPRSTWLVANRAPTEDLG